MNTLLSSLDFDGLIKILNINYKLNIDHVYLHRDMIGFVYIAHNKTKKYVLKLYRPFNTNQAMQSIEVIQYLSDNDYPVVSIVATDNGSYHFTVSLPLGECVGILYNYIDGIEPNIEAEITSIGQQVGKLHILMNQYPYPLIKRGKEFYIERFTNALQELNYCTEKVDELKQYGIQLWNTMSQLPRGFCHGDLHLGNMFKTQSGEYTLFDFDIASYTYPIIDIATISDSTNFNTLDEITYDSTKRMFERFYQGYSTEKTISDGEISAIFDFIAIRHYEIIPTITQCQGMECLNKDFLDEQHEWLMKWKNLCDKKTL